MAQPQGRGKPGREGDEKAMKTSNCGEGVNKRVVGFSGVFLCLKIHGNCARAAPLLPPPFPLPDFPSLGSRQNKLAAV